MAQQRIHRYLQHPPKTFPTGCSFLDLPKDLRMQTYPTWDIIKSEGPIDLNVRDDEYSRYSMDKQKCTSLWHSHGEGDFEDCHQFSTHLLYVSRGVYQDLAPIIYSKNQFRVSRHEYGQLSALRNLGPLAIASLTSLTIRINECGHWPGRPRCQCGCGKCGPSTLQACPLRSNRPLNSIYHFDRSVISEITSIFQHFSKYTKDSQLSICLICDVADVKTAQAVVRPLLDVGLPLLRECSIRLSQASDEALRSLAESTSLNLVGRPTKKCLFRFSDLSDELQVMILERTELVCPDDIKWDPALLSKGPWIWNSTIRCTVCTEVYASCCHSWAIHRISRDYCECYRLRVGTSNSLASQYLCWRMPTALFQVNHKFRQEATRIFYSMNHFIVLPYRSGFESRWKFPVKEEQTLPPFINIIPAYAPKYIRSLQYFLRPKYLSFTCLQKPPRDWLSSIAKIGQKLDVTRLTLIIDMSRERPHAYDWRYHSHPPPKTPENNWTAYVRAIKQVAHLQGLRDFFVHTSWPNTWDDDDNDTGSDQRHEREKLLEQLVMGPAYDSTLRGKFAHPDRFRFCGYSIGSAMRDVEEKGLSDSKLYRDLELAREDLMYWFEDGSFHINDDFTPQGLNYNWIVYVPPWKLY